MKNTIPESFDVTRREFLSSLGRSALGTIIGGSLLTTGCASMKISLYYYSQMIWDTATGVAGDIQP